MPRIDDRVLECVVYLYRSRFEASQGEPFGGSGFLLYLPAKTRRLRWSAGHYYVVTASHIVREANAPIIRMTDRDGHTAIEERSQGDWVHHADGEDLAVCYLGLSQPKRAALHADSLLRKSDIVVSAIGPGDEVYMISRFVTVEGKQGNTPTVRFGHLSMMPGEGVVTSRGLKQVGFMVEMHSLPGYSGSPVFVRVPEGEPWPDHVDRGEESRPFGTWLLGVDWGHIPNRLPVLDADEQSLSEKLHVQANSGLAGVVPAWNLENLLDSEAMTEERRLTEERWLEDVEKGNYRVSPDAAQFFRLH